ncbi:maleylpyruvate isomerase family mycothiol-dependent enzyme [Actinacidiphila acididurans]|uniref:maleylpyruvate isomerase family mycothiol-dependent enzyme n=1 Tax=Actinacidiphila acididurans TaxID=2784346 RepID=UPI0027DEA48D|nr:maleylpyruvate isomerase family mycothiol-dependent enzyme [Actinacidiphila acididurans]
MTVTAPIDLLNVYAEGQTRLRGLLTGLTDEALRAPSALPGWTRGHVLTHMEGVGLALARQARYALRGRTVEVYDGGRASRDAAIEAGHRRSVEVLTAALSAALDETEASWAAVGPEDWGRPVSYRDGVLLDAGLAWWRELEIHSTDALLGRSTTDWSPEFCAHLVDYLGRRVPAGLHVTLTATDGPATWTWGSGTPLHVEGATTDLAAWLAGRHPVGALTGDPLPPLGNWP